MAGIAAAIIGAGALGAGASIYAAGRQTAAAQQATAAQLGMFQQAQNLQKPFVQAGKAVLPTLTGLLTPGPNQTALLSQLPGFQFAQDWGQRGVANQATVSGLGGNAVAAGAQFATGLAQQGWGDLVSKLLDMSRIGAGAGGNIGQQSVQVGGQVGGNILGIGNAQAGAATAVGANLGNSLFTSMMLRQLGQQQNAPTNAWDAPRPVVSESPAAFDPFAISGAMPR